jgi:hypothetical protein
MKLDIELPQFEGFVFGALASVLGLNIAAKDEQSLASMCPLQPAPSVQFTLESNAMQLAIIFFLQYIGFKFADWLFAKCRHAQAPPAPAQAQAPLASALQLQFQAPPPPPEPSSPQLRRSQLQL